jgi:hypothetical protein
MKNMKLSLLDISIDSFEASKNIIDQISAVLFSHHLSEKQSWLSKIAIRMGWLIPSDQSSYSILTSFCFRPHYEWSEGIWFIVRLTSLISVNSHWAISLSI